MKHLTISLIVGAALVGAAQVSSAAPKQCNCGIAKGGVICNAKTANELMWKVTRQADNNIKIEESSDTGATYSLCDDVASSTFAGSVCSVTCNTGSGEPKRLAHGTPVNCGLSHSLSVNCGVQDS